MAGPWEQFQQSETQPAAGAGPWSAYAKEQPVAVTPGEKEFVADRAKIEAAKGVVPEEVKAGAYSAANAALFNIPSHLVAAGTYLTGDKPYSEVYKEQKAYEEALARQNPISSGVGTAAGIVGGVLLPGGAIGQGLRGAKAIGTGAALSGGMSGVSSAIEKAPEVLEGDRKAWTSVALDTALGGALGGAMAPIAGKIADKFAKMPEVVTTITDDAGNVVQKLTPEAERVVKSAFGDRLSPEDIASFQDDIVKTMQKKGISEAAAREALLAKEGIAPSASIVTGVRPLEGGREAGEIAQSKATDILGQKIAGMTDETVSPFAGAEALQGAERKALRKTKEAYAKSDNVPGAFEEGVRTGEIGLEGARYTPGVQGLETYSVADLVFPEIKDLLQKQGKVINFQQLQSYPASSDAMKLLRNTVVSGEMPYGGKEDLRNMFKVYEQMNALQKGAKGDDYKTLGAIKEGYTNALNRGIEENLFVGGDGAKAMADFAAANKEWGNYLNQFYSKHGGETRVFNRIMSQMIDPDTKFVANSLTPEMAQAAQNVINVNLTNPRIGPALYNRIEKVVGRDTPSMEAFRSAIKNNILTPKNNDLSLLPDQIDQYLSPAVRPVTERAFGAVAGDQASIKAAREQMAELRRLSETIKMVNKRQDASEAEKQGFITRAFYKYVPALVGGAFGFTHGPVTSVLGSIAAQTAAEVPAALTRRGQLKAEQFGAPIVRPEGVIDPRAYQLFRNVPAMDPTDQQSGYAAPTPLAPLPRQGRKKGGRVMAMSGQQLIAALEKAKREVNNQTKVLLNSSDETVARALEIANRNIEG
jgi:hypothetical protein